MKTCFQASFSRYLQCFLQIARFRSASLETTKTTKFGSRAGKTHFLQQLDSLQFSPKSKFYCNLQCFLHLLNPHLEPQNLQICTAPPTPPFSPTGKTSKRWKRFPSPQPPKAANSRDLAIRGLWEPRPQLPTTTPKSCKFPKFS